VKINNSGHSEGRLHSLLSPNMTQSLSKPFMLQEVQNPRQNNSGCATSSRYNKHNLMYRLYEL